MDNFYVYMYVYRTVLFVTLNQTKNKQTNKQTNKAIQCLKQTRPDMARACTFGPGQPGQPGGNHGHLVIAVLINTYMCTCTPGEG